MNCAHIHHILFVGVTNYLNKETKVHVIVTVIETEAAAVPRVHLLLRAEMMDILVEDIECYQ
jgi:hypothetical protein